MAHAPIYKPPEQFSFVAGKWKSWIAQWNRFRKLIKNNKEDEEQQIDALIYHMGTSKAEGIMKTFKYGKRQIPNPARADDTSAPATIEEDESDKKYVDVVKKFHNHFVPKVNIVNESAQFHK